MLRPCISNHVLDRTRHFEYHPDQEMTIYQDSCADVTSRFMRNVVQRVGRFSVGVLLLSVSNSWHARRRFLNQLMITATLSLSRSLARCAYRTVSIMSFHSIHNVVDSGVLQAMWEKLVGQVVHRDRLIIC